MSKPVIDFKWFYPDKIVVDDQHNVLVQGRGRRSLEGPVYDLRFNVDTYVMIQLFRLYGRALKVRIERQLKQFRWQGQQIDGILKEMDMSDQFRLHT